MKNRSLTRLLVQSEEEPKHYENGVYALFALSAVVSIWQFASNEVRYHWAS